MASYTPVPLKLLQLGLMLHYAWLQLLRLEYHLKVMGSSASEPLDEHDLIALTNAEYKPARKLNKRKGK